MGRRSVFFGKNGVGILANGLFVTNFAAETIINHELITKSQDNERIKRNQDREEPDGSLCR